MDFFVGFQSQALGYTLTGNYNDFEIKISGIVEIYNLPIEIGVIDTMNKNQIKQRIKDKVEKGILEPKNANLVSKLIDDSNINDEEAFSLYQLISSYQRAGLHYNPTITERISDTIHYLKKDKEHSFIQDETKPVNKLILGDNYHALKNLLISYRNQIDVIYIDPPYSCSGDGKKADTNYANSYPRDTLLSLLHPRLELALDLLTDEGIIFVSIDDRNQAYVKCLMDEVFGEENFVANIIWQNKYTISNDKKNGMTTQTEYILLYTKTHSLLKLNPAELRKEYIEKTYSNPDNDPNGLYMTVQLYKKKNPKVYTVVSPTGKKWTKPWNYTEEGFKELINKGLVFWGKDGNACPRKKVYLKDSKGMGNRNLWLYDEVGTTGDGGNEIELLGMNRNDLLYPKPVDLIKKIIKISADEKATILDFFAGSGTTGQAVMELNKEDGGNRKFILATLKEDNGHNIGIDVCAERLKRVMTGSGYNDETNFDWIKKNEVLGGNLEVMNITSIANNSQKVFDEIDETLYDVEKIDNIQNKIKWVCDNFEDTQIVLEDKVED